MIEYAVIAIIVILFCLAVWFSHRYAWWRATVAWENPRILMYHMVCAHKSGAKFNKMRVPPSAFRAQLKWLTQNGFRFVTMSELYHEYRTDAAISPKTVVLTFDDGYADNCINALPVLQEFNAKATLYLVLDRHDRDWDGEKKAHHNSGELKHEPKLSDEQVLALVQSGLVEIASHTITHLNMCQHDDADVEFELAASKQYFEEQTAQPIRGFAYPFGFYAPRHIEQLMQCGYEHAVTTEQGIDVMSDTTDWFQLKRIKVSGKDSLYAFKTRIRTGKRGWK